MTSYKRRYVHDQKGESATSCSWLMQECVNGNTALQVDTNLERMWVQDLTRSNQQLNKAATDAKNCKESDDRGKFLGLGCYRHNKYLDEYMEYVEDAWRAQPKTAWYNE